MDRLASHGSLWIGIAGLTVDMFSDWGLVDVKIDQLETPVTGNPGFNNYYMGFPEIFREKHDFWRHDPGYQLWAPLLWRLCLPEIGASLSSTLGGELQVMMIQELNYDHPEVDRIEYDRITGLRCADPHLAALAQWGVAG